MKLSDIYLVITLFIPNSILWNIMWNDKNVYSVTNQILYFLLRCSFFCCYLFAYLILVFVLFSIILFGWPHSNSSPYLVEVMSQYFRNCRQYQNASNLHTLFYRWRNWGLERLINIHCSHLHNYHTIISFNRPNSLIFPNIKCNKNYHLA